MCRLRLFYAIRPDDDFREFFLNFTAGLRRLYPGLKIVPLENCHMTLCFLGDVDALQLPVLKNLCRSAAHQASFFDVPIDSFGAFPSLRNPSVLWLGSHQCPSKLTTIVSLLEKSLRENGFNIKSGAFVPHITVARVKRTGYSFINARVKLPPRGIFFKVRSVELIRSILTSDGSLYETLERSCIVKSGSASQFKKQCENNNI